MSVKIRVSYQHKGELTPVLVRLADIIESIKTVESTPKIPHKRTYINIKPLLQSGYKPQNITKND